jgi:hypothetical protein
MTIRRLAVACVVLLIAGGSATAIQAAKPPATWDNLVLAKSKRFQRVYLLPDADFRPYTKVMLDPTEVAFRKNWVKDYNNSASSLGRRMDDQQAQRIIDQVRKGFGDSFAKAYAKAGITVVQTPGPDVLRVRTGVVDLAINAPDVPTAGRSRSYSSEAGQAMLVVEVRDSETGALLGRVLDRQIAGDSMPYMRNSVSNTADFSRMFDMWAKSSVDGFKMLQTRNPAQAPVAEAKN